MELFSLQLFLRSQHLRKQHYLASYIVKQPLRQELAYDYNAASLGILLGISAALTAVGRSLHQGAYGLL